jgi:putative endopeptidase
MGRSHEDAEGFSLGETTVDVPAGGSDETGFDPGYPVGADFYRHVNAKWLAANPIPPEYGAWGAFHEVHVRNEELLHELLDAAAATPGDVGSPEVMAGDYWASGLDEAAIEQAGLAPLEKLFETIDSLEDITDLARVMVALRRGGVGMLFGSYVSPDFEDSTQYLLYLVQGGLGLPERDYYFRDDDHSVGLRAEYVSHVARMLGLVGRDGDTAGTAKEIMALETTLAKLSFTPTELRDADLTTNKIRRADYATAMPGFELADYLGDLADGVPGSVNIDNPGFFASLAEVLGGVPPSVLRSYLRWNLIRATAGSLSVRFVEASFDFYGKLLGGQRELKPRWKRVLGAASADIGQQVSQLYVHVAFGADAKDRCESMVDRLLVAMEQSLQAIDWMSEETKDKALKKLAGFSYKIGYPDDWRDYSALTIDRGPYVANRLRAASFEYNRKIAKLNKPVDKNEWAMEPHAVNAYYHPLYNEVVFPAGILQPPFFWADADDATNFGAIGTVIGHEITHGFDDQGSKFDADGNLKNWWTESDRAAFEDRTGGLADQYSAYEPLAGLNVNGELTLGENIADLGGVTIAYAAMLAASTEQGLQPHEPVGAEDGLTPAQRFFISYAKIWRGNYTDEYTRLIIASDPHSPGEYRCNGVLENFPPFAEAFALDNDAPLAKSPADVLKIW